MVVNLRKTTVSMTWTEPTDICDSTEDLEITNPGLDETTKTSDLAEKIQTCEPSLTEQPTIQIPPEKPEVIESTPQATNMSQTDNLQIMEPNLTEDLEIVPLNPQETVDTQIPAESLEVGDRNLDDAADERESIMIQNGKVLVALKNARAFSHNGKQLTKIIAKMEKGKNLKRKEFATVYLLLREAGSVPLPEPPS